MGDTAKQFSLQSFRPSGFGYPIGLNSLTGQTTTVDYLVVAGGGGGGSGYAGGGGAGNGGGGGAGGLLTGSTTLYSPATYIVTVGSGGAGQTTSGIILWTSCAETPYEILPSLPGTLVCIEFIQSFFNIKSRTLS